jgi:hypothetical protein
MLCVSRVVLVLLWLSYCMFHVLCFFLKRRNVTEAFFYCAVFRLVYTLGSMPAANILF